MNVRAVTMVARSTARRRSGQLLLLVVLIGLVGAVVLAALAGARRSATALDRFQDATNARDGGVWVEEIDAAAAADVFGTVEGVTDAASSQFFLADVGSIGDFGVTASPDGRAFTEIGRPLLRSGRMPDPDSADEVMLNEPAARQLGVAVGDVVPARTVSDARFDQVREGTASLELDGPELALRVVGIGTLGDDLQGSMEQSTAMAVGSPAFYREHIDTVGSGGSITWVTWSDPATLERLEARLAESTDGAGGVATVAEDYQDTTAAAIAVVSVGLLVFALVAFVAGAVAVGQAVSRQLSGDAIESSAARPLGLTSSERVASLALPVLVAILAGSVLAVAGAVAASGLFPIAVARTAEPEPGIRVDPLVLGAAWFVLVLLIGVWTLVSARHRDVLATRGVSSPRQSAHRTVVGVGPAIGPRLGARFALDPGRGRSAVPARSALVGAVLGVAGVVALVVFSSSLSTTLDEPSWWGWNWSSRPDLADSSDPGGTLERLASDPDLTGVAGSFIKAGTIDGERVQLQTFVVQKGSVGPTLLSGRLPVGPAEVTVGSNALERIGRSIGDRIDVDTGTGATVTMTVVGEAVGSSLLDNNDNGGIAVISAEAALGSAEGDAVSILDGAGYSGELLLTYRDGVDVAALENRLEADHGLSFESVSRPSPPGRLINIDDMHSMVVLLGGFFALIGLVGVAHVLVVSTRRRAVQFAVLGALGLVPRQLRSVVRSQAVVIALIGGVVGVTLGIILGRLAWQAAVGDLGIEVSTAAPWTLLTVVVVATVVSFWLVSVAPSFAASRRRPALLLRTE